MKRRLALLRLVLDHPLNRSNKPLAATRWAAWQAWKTVARRPVTIRMWRDVQVRVYPDWPYSWTALYMKLAEYDDMMFTLRYLRPGDAFVDVGANIGYYTLLAATVNGGAAIVAFEPHPIAAARLRQNVRLNKLDNVFVVESAIGDIEGTARITTNLFDQNRIALDDEETSTDVPLVTLDGELKRQAIDAHAVALVKVDTEGFESKVIRGSGSLLAEEPGAVWIVELTGLGARYGSDDRELLRTFGDAGYHACTYSATRNVLIGVDAPQPERGNLIFARDLDEVAVRLGIRTRTAKQIPATA